MRKVVLYELLSLNGVAEDPGKFVIDWDEAMDANLAAVIATQDAVILGRRSYDEWSEFGQTARLSRSPRSSTTSQSTSHLPRRWGGSGTVRQRSKAGWSSSCRTSRIRPAVTLASTPASRSLKRCSPRTPSTKYGSSTHRRSLTVGDGSWTDCRRFGSNCSVARGRPEVICLPTTASCG
jgi:hypothetical protein